LLLLISNGHVATRLGTLEWRFAAQLSGLAFGLALAVKPAGLAEVSRVNGTP
jgi:hypothetical protein